VFKKYYRPLANNGVFKTRIHVDYFDNLERTGDATRDALGAALGIIAADR
jgi:hypothetical protein